MPKKQIFITVIILVIYSWLLFSGVFDTPIFKLNDICSRLKYFHKYRNIKDVSEGKVAIVSFDDETFQKIKEKWPWKRDLSAKLIDNINKAHPKLIVCDIAFLGESDPKNDQILLNSIKNAGNVLLASFISDKGEYVKPYGPFAEASIGFGIINKPRDKDYVIRRSRALFLTEDYKIQDYSLSVKTIASFYGAAPGDIKYRDKILYINGREGEIKIPLDPHYGTFWIDFIGKPENFIVLPVWEVLSGDYPEGLLKDKIVLLGIEAEVMHDIYNTPLGVMSGLIGNANEIVMLLKQDYPKSIPFQLNFIFIITMAILSAIIISYLGIWPGLLFILLEITLFWLSGAALFFKGYRTDLFSIPFISAVLYIAINFYKAFNLILENIKLKEEAITDSLTGLYLRRYLQVRLEHEISRFQRFGQKLSLLMIDIDHFKKINDTYGHQKGDEALKMVASALLKNIRKIDIACRFGGEEFAIMLPNTTTEGAKVCAEKIRALIENTLVGGIKKNVTVSIGVASLGPASEKGITSPEELIKAADSALYQAKESGRNKVILTKPQ